MENMEFKIIAQSENPTKTVVNAGNFTLTIDEPAELGGTNAGANPVEFVLASLAGCINVMAHVAAGEMGLKLRGVTASISGILNPSKLFGEPTATRAGFQSIEVKLTPDCDADAKTIEKWLEVITERSPVLDNLVNATPVKITI
jgi:Predicted redox protein, regulator of disulfide bond formation